VIGQSDQNAAEKPESSATRRHDQKNTGDGCRTHSCDCRRSHKDSGKEIGMSSAPLQCRSVQQLLTDLCHLGFSDTAIARLINCRPETIARVRTGEQSGRNIAERLLILAEAYNLCRLSR
jgi:hypothetical protein